MHSLFLAIMSVREEMEQMVVLHVVRLFGYHCIAPFLIVWLLFARSGDSNSGVHSVCLLDLQHSLWHPVRRCAQRHFIGKKKRFFWTIFIEIVWY